MQSRRDNTLRVSWLLVCGRDNPFLRMFHRFSTATKEAWPTLAVTRQ